MASAVAKEVVPASDMSEAHPATMEELATPAKDMVGAGVQQNPIKGEKQRKKEKLALARTEKTKILSSFAHFKKLDASSFEEKVKEMEERHSDEMGPEKIKKIKKEKKRIKKERAEAAILDGGGTAGFNLRFY